MVNPTADFKNDGAAENKSKQKKFKMNKIVITEVRRCALQSSSILLSQRLNVVPQHHQPRRNFTQNFWSSVSASAPVTSMQEAITQLHDVSGLPWWSTLIVSTVLLRGVITFPLSIYQAKILAKVEQISGEMPAIVKELKVETFHAIKKFNWTESQARVMYNRSLKKQWNNLVIRENCHPAKATIVILFQVPLWITQSWAIRNLINLQPDPTSIQAQIIASEMMFGGFGWIPNLTEVDHSLILPVMLGIINLSNIEVTPGSAETSKNTNSAN